MTCELCRGSTTEEHNGDVCDYCGAIHPEEDWVELRDVIVEIWQISENHVDNREPEWDTEYAAEIYVGDDVEIINGDVYHIDYSFEMRHLDEVGIMGMFISREMVGTFRARVDHVRVHIEEEHEYLEVTNGDDFRSLTDESY